MGSALAKALLQFQGEGVHLQRDAINPHYNSRHISLGSLMGHVMPVMNRCGLVLLQMPTVVDGVPALTTRIVEATSGEFVEATMPLSLAKVDPQSQGSALTYARRYALMAFLGLVADEDTDGNAPKSKRSASGNAEPAAGAAEKPMASTRSAAPADGTLATEAQRKRLFALAKEAHIEGPELKAIVEKITGQGSTAGIPKDLYEKVCMAVQSAPLAKALADGTADDIPF